MARRPRIAIGGIAHETNTFAITPTTLDDVRQRTLLTGNTLLARARGSDGALGGIVDAAVGRADLLPTLFASATPGGPMERPCWETLRHGLLSRLTGFIRRYPGVDAVILVQHGALVVDDIPDAEGTLFREIRSMVGNRPLLTVVDFHANLSPAIVETADLVVPYRTYPHLDTRACGVETLEACLAILQGELHPTTAWRALPIRCPLPTQTTEGDGAFARLSRQARAVETLPGVYLAALVPGFPYSDDANACASVLVTTDNDPSLAGRVADELASAWMQARPDLAYTGVSLVDLASILHDAASADGPIVLADIADNPGAGAPGDSTFVVRHLLETGQRDVAVATITDPASVAACHAAGVGAGVSLAIGGKSSPWSGTPLVGRWRVHHLGDGVFTNRGPIGRGGTTRLGRTATVERDGIAIILSERRVQVLEPAIFAACGIQPERRRALVVKSSVHYRAGFGPVAHRMIDVETPGLSRSDIASLESRDKGEQADVQTIR